jgi:hypothetical protein
MPFKIEMRNNKWLLYNIAKKEYVKTQFKTKDSAISAGKNYMRYRNEVPWVQGNMILHKK